MLEVPLDEFDRLAACLELPPPAFASPPRPGASARPTQPRTCAAPPPRSGAGARQRLLLALELGRRLLLLAALLVGCPQGRRLLLGLLALGRFLLGQLARLHHLRIRAAGRIGVVAASAEQCDQQPGCGNPQAGPAPALTRPAAADGAMAGRCGGRRRGPWASPRWHRAAGACDVPSSGRQPAMVCGRSRRRASPGRHRCRPAGRARSRPAAASPAARRCPRGCGRRRWAAAGR